MLRDLIPVVTLVIGYAIKSFTDYFENRRAVAREREARDVTRKDRLFERRSNFQRETLLALQDAVTQLGRDTGAINHQNIMSLRTTGKLGLITEEFNEGYRIRQATTSKLVSRVHDNSVRVLTDQFRDASVETIAATTEQEGNRAMNVAYAAFEQLNQRIGIVLRSLDDAEDAA
jgi:hypothetical protein